MILSIAFSGLLIGYKFSPASLIYQSCSKSCSTQTHFLITALARIMSFNKVRLFPSSQSLLINRFLFILLPQQSLSWPLCNQTAWPAKRNPKMLTKSINSTEMNPQTTRYLPTGQWTIRLRCIRTAWRARRVACSSHWTLTISAAPKAKFFYASSAYRRWPRCTHCQARCSFFVPPNPRPTNHVLKVITKSPTRYYPLALISTG